MPHITSLASKIRHSAFGLASLVVGVLGMVMLIGFATSMHDKQAANQNAGAKTLALHIQTTLNRQIDALNELSKNPLIWTAFIDNVERETQLSPYLRYLNTNASGIQGVTLIDYRGRPLAGDTKSPEFSNGHLEPFIQALLLSGKPGLEIHREGELHAWAGFPVRYPDMDAPIGILLGMIPFEENLLALTQTIENGQGFALSSKQQEIFKSNLAATRYNPARQHIEHPHWPGLYTLDIELYSMEGYWLDAAWKIGATLLLTGGLLIWLVWKIAGFLATRLTGRLTTLTQAVTGMRPNASDIPGDGSGDELDQLALAFRRTLEDYEKLAQSLEEIVQERTQSLSESEARYRQSFEVNTAVKLIIDPENGAIIDANSAAQEFYGLTRERLLALTLADIDVSSQALTSTEFALQKKNATAHGKHTFGQHKCANGEIKNVEVYAGPATVGQRTFLYTIIHDVSERIAAENALIEAKRSAEAANMAKSRFLAMMSHEIRTPMNGILGMAQLLLNENVTPEERQDFALVILNSGQTLLTLLNDILDLSKIEAGKVNLEQIAFQPARLLHEIHILFNGNARSRQLEFFVEWRGDPLAQYLGDPYRLQQMLSNLVSNALKFTQSGSVRVLGEEKIRDASGVTLQFTVTDTGAGIPEEKQQQLFQPFCQADDSTTRRYGGTGLGLSIVKYLSHVMGGTIGLESEQDRGSCFWFTTRHAFAPLAENSICLDRPQQASDSPPSTHSQLKGHALIVEDDPINRKVIQSILQRQGLLVSLAENGQQGVGKIQENAPFDIIFMDIRMPVMDGYTATAHIRAFEQREQRLPSPIVALTADAFESDKQQALDAGMSDFLPKPIDVKALRQVLERYLPVDQGRQTH